MPVLSIYLLPAPESDFYRIGSALLGYDVYSGTHTRPLLAAQYGNDTMQAWIGIARLFGLHATLGEAVSYAPHDLDELHARMDWIASRTPPFALTNGRFHDSFALRPYSITTTFDDPAGIVAPLHQRIVTMVQVLYDTSPFFAPHLHTFAAADRIAFYRYGAPGYRILQNFSLHFSLASSFPDWRTRQQVHRAMLEETGLFCSATQRTLHIDALYMLEQQPDRHFRPVAAFPLRG
ncbi:MAG: hypothetical protein HC893_10255 [Chloroflexaceae bacterium]|nr:hypothetical protein [Chloroflexaceae bacterium]NJL34160.1 hypothetical protein [Chloroflexaceae bacterium]NJO07393.1 hypothetical protein [Chloroflexaceae bacterium]